MATKFSKNKKYIGVFDSGFGGLHVLRGIVRELPEYNYIYVGDSARTPYGTRSQKIVYEFTKQAVDFLFQNGCELVILACNTASSDALRKIQKNYISRCYPDKKVLGVLIPAAEEAVKQTKNGRVGVIATEGTVRCAAFPREIFKLDPSICVFQKACPLFVPFVESGEHKGEAARIMVKQYLTPLMQVGIDTLILGCTHYGILESQIRDIVGENVYIISGSRVVPKKLKEYLKRHTDIEEKLGRGGTVQFYSTDLTPTFEKLGGRFFGKPITVKKMTLS